MTSELLFTSDSSSKYAFSTTSLDDDSSSQLSSLLNSSSMFSSVMILFIIASISLESLPVYESILFQDLFLSSFALIFGLEAIGSPFAITDILLSVVSP